MPPVQQRVFAEMPKNREILPPGAINGSPTAESNVLEKLGIAICAASSQ